jgi:putative endopeptidase
MNIRQFLFFQPKKLSYWGILIGFFVPGIVLASMASRPGFQLENIDHSVSFADNFYDYANGNWQKANPIPDEESRWGTFNILRNTNNRQVRYILEAAAENTKAAAGSEIKKIGDFYSTGIDIEKANQLGLTPIRPELEMIKNINNIYDLQNTLQHFQLHGIDVIFNLGQMQDFKDSQRIIAVLDQGGLGLPDRDYYFNQDTKTLIIRNAYLRHIATLFRMLGENDISAKSIAKSILSIETDLAKKSLHLTQRRDPAAIYHLHDIKSLNKLTPVISWEKYFVDMGLAQVEEVNITQPEYFRAVDKLLHHYSLNSWKNYLRWRLLDATARTLSAPFINQNFSFKSRLSGSKEIRPRWKRVTDEANRVLGFAIGHIYVDLYFPASSKKQVIDILTDVRKALRTNINNSSWLSPATRHEALAKLDSMRSKIAYPSNWRDYSELTISRDSYARNILNGNAFLIRRELNKIGSLTHNNEWLMTPQSVNAYYNPSMNEIVFPAAILQAPFFDSNVPDAINYGAIGTVIGHEISHGFDDQGSQFDGHGNLRNWWTNNDKKNFNKSISCISKQFESYVVDGEAHLQGELVTGEAIADLVGLKFAWQAFSNSHDIDEVNSDFKLSATQLFFFGFAHVWASTARPEYLRTRVQTDPHPPANFRINGTLTNFPPFAKYFSLKPGDKLYKKSPCKIW